MAGAQSSLNLVIVAINDLGLMFYASRASIVLIILVAISSLFATAFQCPLPIPWFTIPSTCPNAAVIYEYIAIANMIMDILLCALSIAMVWVLENCWSKFLVMALFASRIL